MNISRPVRFKIPEHQTQATELAKSILASIENSQLFNHSVTKPPYTLHQLKETDMTNSPHHPDFGKTNKALTPHKWAEVIKAWADGKEIEWRLLIDPIAWNIQGDQESPQFNSSSREWRIKPEVQEGWINIYEHSFAADYKNVNLYFTKEHADVNASKNRIACIKISYTSGEGL